MRVLGIETSCDETGVALIDSGQGLLGHALYSQATTHAEYGGVVPELASRDHVRKLLPMLRRLMQDCGVPIESVGGVAYTAGPGLIGALLAGACIGRSLAWGWGVPALGVHHMEAHLLSPMLEDPELRPPFVALLVSGGHTMLVEVRGIGRYQLLGETLDDAAGEAFDKTAKLLSLGYPGGPALAQLAESGNAGRFHFPRPMTNRPGLDFSFSGLKTHALTTLRQSPDDAQTRADIARAFEDAVVDTFVVKCRRALARTGLKRLIVSGGVGANRRLRRALNAMTARQGARVYYPRMEFCTDNAAMIALAGLLRLQAGECDGLEIRTRARWSLTELRPPASQ